MGEQVMPLARTMSTRTKSMPVVSDVGSPEVKTPDVTVTDKNQMIRKKAADTAKKLISRSISRCVCGNFSVKGRNKFL